MKIKLSKVQREGIGKKAGWMKISETIDPKTIKTGDQYLMTKGMFAGKLIALNVGKTEAENGKTIYVFVTMLDGEKIGSLELKEEYFLTDPPPFGLSKIDESHPLYIKNDNILKNLSWLFTTANKKRIKISKSQWETIGRKENWVKPEKTHKMEKIAQGCELITKGPEGFGLIFVKCEDRPLEKITIDNSQYVLVETQEDIHKGQSTFKAWYRNTNI